MTSQTHETSEESYKSKTERKEAKASERRRKKYKFALVRWVTWYAETDTFSVEHKENLKWKSSFSGEPEILCDDQPERVLRGMLKLLKESNDE